MGFADSGTAFTITNPADIATAIGADPSGQAARLVDNKPIAYSANGNLALLAGGGTAPVFTQIDVSTAVMVSIGLGSIVGPLGALALATAPVGILGFDLQLDWYDPTGLTLLYSEAYEVNCLPTPPIGQTTYYGWQAIVPARGALLTVTATNAWASSWPGAAGGGFVAKVNTSSRVVPPALRSFVQSGPVVPPLTPYDGLILDKAAGTNAASSQTILLGNLAVGDVFVSFLGATTQQRIDVSWGAGAHGLLRDVRTWAATNNSSGVFGPFPAVNRPLNVLVANLSSTAAGAFNVSAWSRGISRS